jgi:MbtH protein
MSEDHSQYICLINKEEQYSLWFSWKEIPLGWEKVGPTGNKEQCLNYIKSVWTDMRPKSLKEIMNEKTTSQI